MKKVRGDQMEFGRKKTKSESKEICEKNNFVPQKIFRPFHKNMGQRSSIIQRPSTSKLQKNFPKSQKTIGKSFRLSSNQLRKTKQKRIYI
jgi:hypothetical protein